MQKHRFYSDRLNLREGSSIKLEHFDSEHIRKSLRLKKGDIIYIFNGQKEFEAKLKLVTNEVTMAQIVKEIKAAKSSSVKFTLFQALTKAKSFELVLEKVTELGVNQIIPFESDFSTIKSDYVKKKYGRWKKIILSACKQSERLAVPEIKESITFNEILNLSNNFDKFIVFNHKKDITKEIFDLTSLKNFDGSIAFVIGPEGGFSPAEIEKLQSNEKIEFASLGDTILRAETAAVSAFSILKFVTDAS